MSEYARVVTFEADGAALDALVSEINAHDGPPEGVPATRLVVLADRAAGKIVIATRFASDEDLRTGSATLDAMTPPADSNMRRVAVDQYEVVLDRSMS